MLYSQLAVKKSTISDPIFVFLDKQCLTYGQNWEDGFLNGLASSKVIVLLMSNKVCMGDLVDNNVFY